LSDRGNRSHVAAVEPSSVFIRCHHDPNTPRNERTNKMNKDRIEGSVEQAKGKMKEVAGKVTGDSKLETEGKVQQVAGKVQNAVGGFKDTVKDAVKQ
jgi:uncharacterized protein YjbJ (UPF0337 family)